MKKIISLFLTLCIIITVFSTLGLTACAESGTLGDNMTFLFNSDVVKKISDKNWFTYTINDGEATITDVDYQLIKEHVQIPSEVDGYPITTIGRYAFAGCEFKSIAIPECIKKIEKGAFEKTGGDVYIANLESWLRINFESDESNPVYGDLYINGDPLTSLVIPSGISTIGNYVFYGCENITNVIIPEGVTLIGNGAFSSCSLKELIIPDTVTTIGVGAFFNCDFEKLNIPRNLESISDNAFSYCKNLKVIVIPENVKSIGYNAFSFCENLEHVEIEGDIISIEEEAFSYTALYENEKNWDNGVLYIDNCLIDAKSNVRENYDIKSGTTVIADCAFQYSDFYNVYIPDSVTSIGTDAFWGCSNITIFVDEANEYYMTDENNILYDSEKTVLIHYPSKNSKSSYTVPESVKKICGYSFNENQHIEELYLPKDMKFIEPWAFYGCSNLRKVDMPDNALIGYDVFSKTKIYTDPKNWENGNLYIGNYLIEAASTENYEIKPGTKSIAGSAFFGTKFKSITVPDSVKTISGTAFSECYYLMDIYYDDSEDSWSEIYIDEKNQFWSNISIHFKEEPKININFENITFEDKFFEYDGTAKELLISGNLPEGATVRYTDNKASKAGTYNATAVITAEGYNTLTLSATMTIGFKVNDIALPLEGYEIGKPWDNCWTFAQKVYQEIWKTDEGEDLLRSLEKKDKKITEKNARNFILSSELGANIRLEDGENVNIHSLVLVQKDNEGFTVYHGNYNGAIYFTHYTYSEFAQHYADYKYFEYISFPDAPEYSKASQNITIENIPVKTYGDASFALTVTPDAIANLSNFTYDSSNKNVAKVDESGNVTIVGAGETIISITEVGNEDYAKTTVTKKLTVNKKALEIKVDNVTTTYGDVINTNITYTGFVGGDDETVLTKAVKIGGYSAKPDAGEHDIILSGAKAANYEISYVNAKLTINKKDVTITQLKVFDKAADSTTNAAINTSSLVIDGMILGDDVTIDFTNANAEFATAEVGRDISVNITNLALAGTHAGNYNLTNTEFVTSASIKEAITAANVASQIVAPSIVKDSAKITLPAVISGFKITLKSSENEGVVKADGSILPVENDTPVGLIFTVTNEADETDVADTSVINVIIPASSRINIDVTAEDNGTVTGSGVYLKNSDVTIIATPDNGYKFKGWYNGEDTVSENTVYTFKAENDISLVAKFAKKTSSGGGGGSSAYIVKFETNGGSKIASQSLKRNSIVKEPAAPTKEGCTFDGWYTDKNLTNAYNFESKVTKGFTLYAKWEDIKKSQIILTIGNKEALVFGETIENDVAPKIVEDRTMLPIRFIAEALGAEVIWTEEEPDKVLIKKNDIEITITIGSNTALVNNEKVTLDSSAFIENDRTYLPLRFVSENLGARVEWLEKTQTVIISK